MTRILAPERPAPDASPIRLWVDAAGLILRAELRQAGEWITVDLPDAAAPALELPGGGG